MSRRTEVQARRAVRIWQERMRLEHWEIEVVFEPENEDANAQVWTSEDYLRARITLFGGWETCDTRTFHATIIHELLHVSTHGMRNAQKSILYKGILTRREEEMYEDRFIHEWERTVDALSYVIYDGYGPT